MTRLVLRDGKLLSIGGNLTTCQTACCCCTPIVPCTARIQIGSIDTTATVWPYYNLDSPPTIPGFRHCQTLSIPSVNASTFIEKYDLVEAQTTQYLLVRNGLTYTQTLNISWEFCRRWNLILNDMLFRIYRSLTDSSLRVVLSIYMGTYHVSTNAQWRRYSKTDSGPGGGCTPPAAVYTGDFPESCIFNGRPPFGYTERPESNLAGIYSANETSRLTCVDLWEPWSFPVTILRSNIHPIKSIANYNRQVTLATNSLFGRVGSINCLGPGNVIIGNYSWPVSGVGTPVLSTSGLNVLTLQASTDPGIPQPGTLTIKFNAC
jgi:hypothetical protein